MLHTFCVINIFHNLKTLWLHKKYIEKIKGVVLHILFPKKGYNNIFHPTYSSYNMTLVPIQLRCRVSVPPPETEWAFVNVLVKRIW